MGCIENNTNEKDNSLDTIEVITTNYNHGPFFYNLVSNIEDSTNWHISIQKIEAELGYYMPSIILNTNVLLAIYNTIAFNDIITIPDNIEWSSDISLISYGHVYEVLHYQYTCSNSEHNHSMEHKILVIPNNYLIKEISTNNIYKVYFRDYDNGIALFQYAQLNVED